MGGKVPSQENTKVSTSTSISCSLTKDKYMSLQNNRLEEHKKGEPIKSKRPIIKKQNRNSLRRRKKNPLRTRDDFRGRECYGATWNNTYMNSCCIRWLRWTTCWTWLRSWFMFRSPINYGWLDCIRSLLCLGVRVCIRVANCLGIVCGSLCFFLCNLKGYLKSHWLEIIN